MSITVTEMKSILTLLRRSLRTSYANTDVRSIASLSQAATDISLQSLCHLDLVDCVNSLKKLTDLLDSTPLAGGTLLPNTMTTSTSDIYAQTQTGLVAALGSNVPECTYLTGVLDLKNLLSQGSYNPMITSQSCDTYLRTLGSSEELVATSTLKDYLIDINIYRLVLFNFIKQKYIKYINYKTYILSHIKQIKKPKFLKNINHLNRIEKLNYLYNDFIEDLSGPIKFVLNCNKKKSLLCARHIISNFPTKIDDSFDIILFSRLYFDEYWNVDKIFYCSKCKFHHDPYVYNIKSIKKFHKCYPLLTFEQCKINMYICINNL